MTLRRNLRLGIGTLVAFNVVAGLTVIAVLSRLGPSFRRIHEERADIFTAANDMLSVLARQSGEAVDPADAERFRAALRLCLDGAASSGPISPLAGLDASLPAVFRGDGGAIQSAVAAIEDWLREHQKLLISEHVAAERIAITGAWFLVFSTTLVFVLTLLVARKIDHRALAPLDDMFRVILAAQQGDYLRRTAPRQAPSDLRAAARALDAILERQFDQALCSSQGFQQTVERAALVRILDRENRAAMVVDSAGEIVLANANGLAALAGVEGTLLRARVARMARGGGESTDPGVDVEPLGSGTGWIVRFEPRADRGLDSASPSSAMTAEDASIRPTSDFENPDFGASTVR
jgi:hypothetical protein